MWPDAESRGLAAAVMHSTPPLNARALRCGSGQLEEETDGQASPRLQPGRVGKLELLKWTSDMTGLSCSRLEDLRSGVVLYALFCAGFSPT